MQPRVTAIVVVRNGDTWLARTLDALRAQSRMPDDLIVVDAGSGDDTAGIASRAAPARVVAAPGSTLEAGIAHGLRAASVVAGSDEWLWLLTADTAPDPQALRRLLAAVEVAPSVAIAGPKLVDADDPGILLSYGESISRLGATVPLVDGELDQAQYDVDSDVMGVTSSAMLVRRSTWEALGGFDPGLPTADAGLDLSIRTRLAGARVVRVPDARVTRGARVEDFGRRKPLTVAGRARIQRLAQLHRRMVYAPAGALVPLWLSLVPLAVLRSFGHLLGKRPGFIGGELESGFAAAFDGSVPAARKRLAAHRSVGWQALAPLRVPADEQRERRAAARARRPDRQDEPELVRASFLSGGGAWIVLTAAVAGLALSWRYVGENVVVGGGLLPLSADVADLWSQLALGPREGAVDLVGPADPFLAVLATLGSLTFWNPSFSIVLLWIIALPLAALGAWWCATRLSERRWPPIVAALLWALAPPLLIALGEGRPAAVLAHLLLPFLVLAGIESARSWAAAATASLLFAATVACAPTLAPVLVVLVIVWAATHPRGIPRVVGIVIPTAVLFAPLVVTQVMRGTPLALLADPGVAVSSGAVSGWQLLLGQPAASSSTWGGFLTGLGLPDELGTLVPAVLLAPMAVVALLSLFLPGARRAVPALIVALLGLGTAVTAAHLTVAASGADPVTLWPGGGLSLYWAGLVGAVVVGLEALRRAAVLTGLAVALTATAAVLPFAAASAVGASPVVASNGRTLPALVAAQADTDPEIGTLVLTAQPDGSLRATLMRGAGTTLDETSTLVSTRVGIRDEDAPLAELVGNIASLSGYDPGPELQELQVAFVVVPEVEGSGAAVRQRTAEALDASADLTPVGDTILWRYADLEEASVETEPVGALAAAVPWAQLGVIAIALLLAIPTRRRARAVRTTGPLDEDPADTFDEDDNG